MNKDKSWYLSWRPESLEFNRDETVLAVGLKCNASSCALRDVTLWLGQPDRVSGNATAGHLVYFTGGDKSAAAFFTVTDGRVTRFGTISRTTENALRKDKTTGIDTPFNILDEMEEFDGSEMQIGTEPGASGYSSKPR